MEIMDYFYSIITGIVLISGYIFYRWITRNNDYFLKKGVAHKKPMPLVGHTITAILQQKEFRQFLRDYYQEFPNEKIIGLFTLTTPFYIIRDPELIKKIAVKDFDHFMDHRKVIDDKSFDNDMLSKVLTALTGQKWKDMRSTLSPAFTTSKMRQMLELIIDCSDEMTKFFQKQTESNNATNNMLVLDMKETFSKFTNDVIATCAFGIKVNSFEQPDNEFYQQGKRILNPNKLLIIASFISFLISPKLIKWFRLDNEARKMEKFFNKLIIDTMQIRERENIYRPDMINLLMQLRKGNLKHDDEKLAPENEGYAVIAESEQFTAVAKKINWKDDELVAQCAQFFLAGFETSSLLLSFTSHALAVHSDVQTKLLEEIDTAFEKSNGKINYSDLQSLKYMDMVISEALRLWPPAIATDRVCVKDYIYDDGNGQRFTFEKGASLLIPIFALHYDPKFFSDPEKFDPERFNDRNSQNIIPGSYIPFGYGPRSCIASRFALMQVKCILYHILRSFTFEICEKTIVPMKMGRFFMMPDKGIHLKLQPRQ